MTASEKRSCAVKSDPDAQIGAISDKEPTHVD